MNKPIVTKTTVTLPVILIVTIIALLVYIFCFTNVPEEDKYSKQKHKIDSLSTLIGNLQKEQLIQDARIVSFKDSLVFIHNEVDNTKQKLNKTRIDHDNKIKNISNLNDAELIGFFTNRYGK